MINDSFTKNMLSRSSTIPLHQFSGCNFQNKLLLANLDQKLQKLCKHQVCGEHISIMLIRNLYITAFPSDDCFIINFSGVHGAPLFRGRCRASI